MRSHEERREEQAAMERRCVLLVSEGEETRAALESAERARKALETELQEANEKYNDLNNQVGPSVSLLRGSCRGIVDSLLSQCVQFQSALSGRRKLEVDLQTLLQEHEELQGELRGSTDKVKKASCEVKDKYTEMLQQQRWNTFKRMHFKWRMAFFQLARVGEELRLEQEHTLHLERVKKGMEAQIKEMSSRLDEAEQMALKGGKKIIQKLEGKVRHKDISLSGLSTLRFTF